MKNIPLKLHNSLTKTIEDFVPITEGKVGLYTCGPTVYNVAHIGNFRAYIFADILRRTLEYANYDVTHVMNLTDVDDKTIRDSQKAGESLKAFTEKYTDIFLADRDALNIVPAHQYTKATDYIPEMVAIIEKLLANGHAYTVEDLPAQAGGSVYFKVASDEKYGQLVPIDRESLKTNAGGRIKSDEYEKDGAQDFALWKAWDAADGDVFWDTALGKGRPGWHIECSAMSMKTLGNHFDIHTGGVDNKFPHHENEIAQSECATGEHFVNYWLHNEWLLVDGKKMAKSAGNFHTLDDIRAKDIPLLAFRYLLLQTHYRTPLNFTWESLEASETALKRLYAVYEALGDAVGAVSDSYREKFAGAMADDLGAPQGLAVMWELAKDTSLSTADKKATMLDLDRVLGLGLAQIAHEALPEEIENLKIARDNARAEKDWARSDVLRQEMENLGYVVKDTDDGQVVTRK